MKKFNQFINEGIRDKMSPKSEEEIKKSIIKGGLTDLEKMYKAVKYGLVWLVKEVIDKIDLKKIQASGDSFGFVFLKLSLDNGYPELVKLFMEKGFDLNKDILEYALQYILIDNHLEMAKFLIEKGATLDSKYYDGDFILGVINTENVEILKLALDIDKNPNLHVDKKMFISMMNQDQIKEDMLKIMIDRIPMVKKISTELLNDYKKSIELIEKCL